MTDMVCLVLPVIVLMGICISENKTQVNSVINGLSSSLLLRFVFNFPHESRYVYLRSSP